MAIYYLSSSGSDGGSGASGSRWRTWSKAKSVMVPGDTLLLTAGDTFTGETWVIDFSGTSSSAEITLDSEDHNNPATIDGNYSQPSDPGSGGWTSKNGVRSLFSGLVQIKCSFVNFRYINVRESQGRGIAVYGTATNHISDVLVEHCEVYNIRNAGIALNDVDDCTVQYCDVHDCSNFFSGAGDAPQGIQWAPATRARGCNDCVFQYNDVHHTYGEGCILSTGSDGCQVLHCNFWNTSSGKLYNHRATNSILRGNLIYDTQQSEILRGSDCSVGISVRNEAADAGISPVNNVLIENNIIIGCKNNFTLASSPAGEKITNVRFFHNILINATSVSGTAHYAVYVNTSVNTTFVSCLLRNNIILQADGRVCNLSSAKSGVTWNYQGWSLTAALVPDFIQGENDIFGVLLANPNAPLVYGAVNPEDYRPSVEYAGLTIAEVTLNFYGLARASNYMGALGTTGGGSPSSGSVFAGVGFTPLSTSGGNEDISDSNIGGGSPKAALVITTNATSAGSGVSPFKLGFGAVDDTSQVAQTGRSRDNVASTLDGTRGVTDMAGLLIADGGTSVTHEASFSAFGPNKVTLNKAGAMTEAMGTIAALFGGADCSAKAGTFTNASAIDGTVDVTPGFEYNLLFVFGHANLYDDTNNPDVNIRIGISTDPSNQACISNWSDNGVVTTDVRTQVNNTVIGVNVLNGQTIKVSARTSTTFTVKTEVATGSTTWGYLALKYAGAKTYVGVDTTPTVTGNKKYLIGASGNRFKPGIVISLQSLVDALNTTKTNDQAGGIGIGVWTASTAHCIAVSNQDNVGTTQTVSIYDTKPFHLLTHAGADGIVGSLVSMDSDGTTINHTTVQGTARYFLFAAIEEASGLQLTGGLEEGFADDVGTLSLATLLTGGLDEGGSSDTGILSTVLVPLPPIIIPHPFPTYSRPQRITVQVYEPLGWGTAQLDDLTAHLDNYGHELTAFGGYWSASIRWKDNKSNLEDWLELGLGRRIVTSNPAGSVAWEGFVNSIALRVGGELAITRGPLLNIANRVRLTYSWIDPAAGLAIGARAQTDWIDDPDSADRYGNLEKMLSTGGVEPTNADQLLGLYLKENRKPETSHQVTIGSSSGESSIAVECLGYFHYLNTYIYNQTTTTGNIDLSAKLQAVLTADPNGYLSASFANITPNTSPVMAVDDSDRKALSVVKDLLNHGDGNLNRYLFGIYADRLPEYRPVVEQVDYTRRLSDPTQTILTPGGQIVEPWDVQPGRWLFYTDFFAGRVESTTALRDDPRAVFLESVVFEAPRTLRINGSRIRRLDQKLAQLGLSGIGG